jgi:hypothetical protein
MALSDCRGALKALLVAITAIGPVVDYEPYSERVEDLLTLFKSPALGYLQGWTITREASAERDKDTESNWREHLFVIRGYKALSGASETDFQDLIETICASLRAAQDDALGGVATLVGPPSVRIVQPRVFAGVLVHYTEIAQRVTEAVALV